MHTEVAFKEEEKKSQSKSSLGSKPRKGIWMLIPMGLNDGIILACFFINLIALTAWFIINTVLYDRK